MDNFDYKAYLKSGKIYGNVDSSKVISESEEVTERKKQGYDDREDESLGARRGAEKDKKQSFKDRRDDSYGKFGKRDAEAKGKDKGPGKNKVNKENVEEVGKGYFKKEHGVGKKGFSMDKRKELQETIQEAYTKIQEGSYPFDQCLDDNEGKYGVEGAKRVCGAIRAAYGEGLVKEDKRTDAEQEGYKDGFEDAKDDIEKELKKMKVSELKAKIREDIIEVLSEQEEDVDVDVDVDDEVEVDADVDVQDDVTVDAEGDDIEIEKKAVRAKVEVGLSPEEEIVQDSLKAAMDAASALGNEKLADQIGNTITFFTREYVVGNRTD
jgi:urease accessory protein UreE|tara:strand:+ start:36 stop:1004 length:969 start_codon:yes stop_codon:yes gene_type:complete